MALLIAGERSGVGKTTITLAMLAFLRSQNYKVQSFKVGPDYIDPMFHAAITGCPCYNLDPILTSLDYVKDSFARRSQAKEMAIVEGVMGLFDGVQNDNVLDYGSSAHIARILNLPVVLVLDCAKISTSVAAIAQGYRDFDPNVKIVGVILNRVKSERHKEFLQLALDSISMPILGILPMEDRLLLPERHLGLVPIAEMDNLTDFSQMAAQIVANHLDWSKLFPLLKLEAKNYSSPVNEPIASVKIALAQDKSFSFYYGDQLEILQELGAQLIRWSPLEDPDLPKDCQGMIFGGGFPEVFAEGLSANLSARSAVFKNIKNGMPTYAECGGLMYLGQKLTDHQGQSWNMVGSIATQSKMTKSLTLGYKQALVLRDTQLFKKGEKLIGHEFHYSKTDGVLTNPLFKISRYSSKQEKQWQDEGYHLYNLHASYLHLHFAQNNSLVARFLRCCLDFSSKDH